MNTPLGDVKPTWDQLCDHVDHPYPSPLSLSHEWVMVRTTSFSFWQHVGLFKQSSERCIIRTQNRCHKDLRLAWLILTHHHHHHHHLHRQQLLPYHTPWERVSGFLIRLSLSLFLVRFLGWQELFSNSHLSVLRECNPRVWSLFTRTSFPPGFHENHLIWMDASLIVPWASMSLLASNNLDQPPPPDHLENLLISVEWTRSI